MEEILVNHDKCVGCGRCTEICPTTFRLNEDGKSDVISHDDVDCAKKAADECPQEAITVEVNIE